MPAPPTILQIRSPAGGMKPLVQEILVGSGPVISFGALAVLGAAVFLVASRLAHDADAIAEETGWGGLWMGVMLLAVATSLPELLTDVNAVLLDVPDIGAGDLFGSTLANMAILATVNLIFIGRHLFKNVGKEHALVGAVAIGFMLVAGIGILSGGLVRIGHIGIETLLIAVLYIIFIRMLWRRSQAKGDGEPSVPRIPQPRRLRRAWIRFGLATAALVFLAPMLVLTAETFAHESGLTTTFVGTLIIGLTTSFPEMSAVYAAVRIGAYDLAVGDIFGSNAFNMVIFLAMDIFHSKGPVLAGVSSDHLLTILLGVICLGIGVAAVLFRTPRRAGRAIWESVAILVVYLGGLALLSRLGPQ